MEGKQIKIKIQKSFKSFDESFNRVKYFSCISNNINDSSLPEKWIIEDENKIGKGMQDPNDEQRKYILDGYKHFMQRYLVRDCIESFMICLDSLFLCLLLVNKKKLPSDTNVNNLRACLNNDEEKSLKKFEYAGLSNKKPKSGKLELLEDKFGLKLPEEYNKIITDLRDIRNCLSHHNGIVRGTDGQNAENNDRKFHWASFRIFGKGAESGEEFEIEINKPRNEAIDICGKLELKDHCKSFEIGKQLSFTASETYEIAFSLTLVARQYLGLVNNKYSDAKEQ